MTLTVNIENNSIAEKILGILEVFKSDGVEVFKIDDKELSNNKILDNFRDGLKELKSIKNNPNNKLKTMDEFLDEL